MRTAVAVLVPLLLLAAAGSSAVAGDTPADPAMKPLHWGETAEGYATVCLERWHAVLLKKLRNASIDAGEGAMAQIAKEKQALFQGKAWCFTDRVRFTPVDHPDVIDGVRTWVQVPDAKGPVDCPPAIGPGRCRWTIQTQHFVEAKVAHAGVPADAVVYVSTPRPIVPPADAKP